jgi:uncharacterized membrane protein YjgN (DUF898 family)
MKRILFWFLVAVGLGAFFFAAAHQGSMTNDENTVLWGSLCSGLMVILAFGSIFAWFYFWKKRFAIMVGRYGGRKAHSRDSEPFAYWSIMFFYLLAFLCFSSVAILGGLTVLPPLRKLLNH